MYTNFLLTGILTDFQLKFLELIQYLRDSTKGAEIRQKEPLITLQYSYITALLNCSYSSITNALNKFEELELLTQETNYRGECATYRYNPSAYNSLISQAKESERTLITGRVKQRKEVSADTILKYMTGKAIMKARKQK